ncbi:MAG: DUF1580 domain-containing protein [Leptolyngbya sp. PLA3]|nr:MAG: DUF1580 domain-containing protein [Cyanobacteria bacterium CYA]MCE7968383.1 DUF1580 domain-containing protein [Leptolyngbya sp. PL-A3]
MTNGANPGAPAAEDHITLAQAAKLAPGRPSSNCVWRWCREGVKAATGTRIRLKHVRFGSRIFTTLQWLNDFGSALAEADAAHFDRDAQLPAPEPAPSRRTSKRSRRASRSGGADEARRRHLEAERELEEAGL